MKRTPWCRLALVVLATAPIAGCDATATSASPGSGGEGGGPSFANPCGEIDASLSERDSEELFSSDHVPVFDVYLPPDAWEDLQAHAVDEQFVPARACYEKKAIGEVGLRFKGAYGSLRNCFDASGHNTCRKLGMKLKFDEYTPEQRLFGLKRLNFQGYRYDDSYLKERVSYDLYRDMDIAAPRAAWAVLRVNGESQGLFGMVEEIDGRFTKHRWPENGDGNLYKEVWPGQVNEAALREHLKTNEDEGDVGSFFALSAALNAAPVDGLRSTLAAYSDLDHFARYMAVDDAIANFDGITTFYTNGSADEAGNHNFYFYEEAPDRFTLIPWDLESTLNLASNFGNVPTWQSLPADCARIYAVWGGSNRVTASGCDRVFRALSADLASYRAAAKHLLEGPMAEASLLAKIDGLADFIRPQATADAHGPGVEKFEQAVGLLKQEIPKLRARLSHLESGEPSVPLLIDVTGVTDFESADGYGILDGTTWLSNAHSKISVEVNTGDPLAGNRSLRISFDYGNEAKPWQQWSFFSIPVEGVQDISRFKAVRFKARSNVSRPFRFDINSPRNSLGESGVQVGWDLALTADAQTFSFELATATTPSWATDPQDDLRRILQAVAGFSFRPGCVGVDANGQLPDAVRDQGWVDIDDIEFY